MAVLRIAKRAKYVIKSGEVKVDLYFLRNLIEEFLEVLDSEVFSSKSKAAQDNDRDDGRGPEVVDDVFSWSSLSIFLSQLPTRRLVRPLVADVALVSKCHLSALYKNEKGNSLCSWLTCFSIMKGFEIHDHEGRQMTDDEVLQAHYKLIQDFQLFTFKKIPMLRELALANVGAINRRTDLSKKLSILSPRELRDLVCTKLKLVSKNDPCSERVDFIIKVVNLRKRLSMPFHYIPTSRKRLSMHLVYQACSMSSVESVLNSFRSSADGDTCAMKMV